MLRSRFFLLALGALIYGPGSGSCTHHLIAGPSSLGLEVAVPRPEESIEPAGMLPTDKRRLIASLKRTACYGSCPVFQVEIWSDGRAVWQGERHVARVGIYSAQVSAEWIAELLQEGLRAGFFHLANHYPANGRAVPDLPETIMMLRKGQRVQRIVDNADAPIALLQFERYWQEKVEALPWIPVER